VLHIYIYIYIYIYDISHLRVNYKNGIVVCFLLDNSPASKFYMPTFRNTLFCLPRLVGDEWLNLRIVWVANGRGFGSKIVCAKGKEGDEAGVGPVTQQVVKG